MARARALRRVVRVAQLASHQRPLGGRALAVGRARGAEVRQVRLQRDARGVRGRELLLRLAQPRSELIGFAAQPHAVGGRRRRRRWRGGDLAGATRARPLAAAGDALIREHRADLPLLSLPRVDQREHRRLVVAQGVGRILGSRGGEEGAFRSGVGRGGGRCGLWSIGGRLFASSASSLATAAAATSAASAASSSLWQANHRLERAVGEPRLNLAQELRDARAPLLARLARRHPRRDRVLDLLQLLRRLDRLRTAIPPGDGGLDALHRLDTEAVALHLVEMVRQLARPHRHLVLFLLLLARTRPGNARREICGGEDAVGEGGRARRRRRLLARIEQCLEGLFLRLRRRWEEHGRVRQAAARGHHGRKDLERAGGRKI